MDLQNELYEKAIQCLGPGTNFCSAEYEQISRSSCIDIHVHWNTHLTIPRLDKVIFEEVINGLCIRILTLNVKKTFVG